MPPKKQTELDLGEKPRLAKQQLTISAKAGKALSQAQTEFNRRMKALENARKAHEREAARLDQLLNLAIHQWMPLIEKSRRANRDLVFEAVAAMDTVKLTPRRRHWLKNLICGKADELLRDPAGLNDDDLDALEAIIEKLDPTPEDDGKGQRKSDEFAMLREMIEAEAKRHGVDLDLGDLDINGDPAEFEKQMEQRFAEAARAFEAQAPPHASKPRKPSKAALERERRQREVEEAKSRDFRSLYKQLAKVLHPDLETDPIMKKHKEDWMKRLTTAHAAGDLRDMLAIEMEWLGEEAGNLSHASDEKLRIYSMVLKEQIDELKARTECLILEPQYGRLARFQNPYYGTLPSPAWIQRDLEGELHRLEEMLAILRSDEEEKRKMICSWAEANARANR